jgi:hypothetical protein
VKKHLQSQTFRGGCVQETLADGTRLHPLFKVLDYQNMVPGEVNTKESHIMGHLRNNYATTPPVQMMKVCDGTMNYMIIRNTVGIKVADVLTAMVRSVQERIPSYKHLEDVSIKKFKLHGFVLWFHLSE